MKVCANGFLIQSFGFEEEVELRQVAKEQQEAKEAKLGSNFDTGFGYRTQNGLNIATADDVAGTGTDTDIDTDTGACEDQYQYCL